MESTKNAVLDFATGHPYVLLAMVIVLVLILTTMCVWPHLCSARRKKKQTDCDEDELDTLIDSINAKQKKRGTTAAAAPDTGGGA